jgi:hypothetical protein
MKELTFLVREAEEGGFYAEAVGVGIFAEGDTMDELKKSVRSGIECYYVMKTVMMPRHLHICILLKTRSWPYEKPAKLVG